MVQATNDEQFLERRLSVSSCGDSGIASSTTGQNFMDNKSIKAFRTNHDYLYAMTEDLAEWLNFLYDLSITVETFFDELDTGVVLCNHAGQIQKAGEVYFQSINSSQKTIKKGSKMIKLPATPPVYRKSAKSGTFMARDNVAQFIIWCRQLGIQDCVLFETEDLVLRKNTKHVILCLLEIARVGAHFGMEVPELIQLEQEIDAELSGDSGLASPIVDSRLDRVKSNGKSVDIQTQLEDNESAQSEINTQTDVPAYRRRRQRWECDMKSLDELVRELVRECQCSETFPMKRLDEGKYLFGDNQMLIFVRVLRNHVMVRVGGGWDSLEHLLLKHDPCRKNQQHSSVLHSGVPVNHQQERKKRLDVSGSIDLTSKENTIEPTESKDDSVLPSKPPTDHEFIKPSNPAPSNKKCSTQLRRGSLNPSSLTCLEGKQQSLLQPNSLKHRTGANGVQRQGMMNLSAVQKSAVANRTKTTPKQQQQQNQQQRRKQSLKTSTPSKPKTNTLQDSNQLNLRNNLQDLQLALHSINSQMKPNKSLNITDMDQDYIEFEKSLKSSKQQQKSTKSNQQQNVISKSELDAIDDEIDGLNWSCRSAKAEIGRQNTPSKIPQPIRRASVQCTQTFRLNRSLTPQPTATNANNSSQSASLPRKQYTRPRRASISQS